MNRFPDRVGEDLLDVTGDLAVDVGQAGFVIAHLPDNSDVLRKCSHLRRDRTHPDKLLLLRWHKDRIVL